MIGLTPHIQHDEFSSFAKAVYSAENVEALIKCCVEQTSFKFALYHHLPPLGSSSFDKLNQYRTWGMDKLVLEYLTEKGHREDPAMSFIFSKSKAYWLSDLHEMNEKLDERRDHRVNLALNYLGDAILAPLYGPSERRGYVFIGFKNPREFYDEAFLWQIHSAMQFAHLRLCVIFDSLRKKVNLTAREAQVIELITFGKTNPEIGQILEISPNTVAGHVKRLFLKFNVTDRVSLALRARTFSP